MVNTETYNIILKDEDEQDYDSAYYIIRCKNEEDKDKLEGLVDELEDKYYENIDDCRCTFSSVYDYIAENLPDNYEVLPIYDFLGA